MNANRDQVQTVRQKILGASSLLFIYLAFGTALAHENHKHPARPRSSATPPSAGPESPPQLIIQQITNTYRAKVEPIFEKKCLQCHGGTPALPWYYSIPGVKQLIDRDLEESRHHLDFSKGYPFVSHATPLEDLQAIQESVEKNSMPPFLYRLAHSEHRLTDEERKAIIEWTQDGIRRLEALPEQADTKDH